VAKKIKVFVDSDVIISSQISKLGAAYFLLNKAHLELYISNLSVLELIDVAQRLKIKTGTLTSFVERQFIQVNLNEKNLKEIKRKFGEYTNDPFDIHVVAAAAKAKVQFLLTYNLKDYKIDKIKRDFNLICLRPAQLLQYLRSLQTQF